MAYEPLTWVLGLSGGTAINDVNLNHMEQGIADAHSLIADLALGDHIHEIADVTGLQASLDGKAASAHAHAIADVTGLQGALDNKSNVGHAHAIDDVTGLQTALDGKAALSHSHVIADLPAGSVVYVNQNGDGTWPNRLTSRQDVKQVWTKVVVASSDPAAVTPPALNGAYTNDLVIGV